MADGYLRMYLVMPTSSPFCLQVRPLRVQVDVYAEYLECLACDAEAMATTNSEKLLTDSVDLVDEVLANGGNDTAGPR